MAFKVAVLTSDSSRHMYFAARIAEAFDLVGVFAESKEFHPETVYRSPQEQEILEKWFGMRAEAEEEFFGAQARAFEEEASSLIRPVPAMKINAPEWIGRPVARHGRRIRQQPVASPSAGRRERPRGQYAPGAIALLPGFGHELLAVLQRRA